MKYGTWLGKLWHSELGTGNLRGAIGRDKDLLVLNDFCDSDTLDGFRVLTADLVCRILLTADLSCRIVLTADLLFRILLSVDPQFMERGLAT
jgi:hypothetical protein